MGRLDGKVALITGGARGMRMRTVFRAADHGSPDGMWTHESVAAGGGPASAGPRAVPSGSAGFACEDTLSLATGTIGLGGAR